jgi:UDP-GlcNAc:undecaprenyl-phosphate/decaprenyl-phosphate GlcNAc-1-phosphate transferase
LLSFLLTPLMRRVAPVFGFLDHPGTRKVHHHPKPLLGGAAIFLAFIAVVLGDLLILKYLHSLDLQNNRWLIKQIIQMAANAKGAETALTQLIGFLLGGAVLFIIGLVDDRFGMSPLLKLSGQIIAAVILYFADIKIGLFIDHQLINFCLTLFWIVLITNSFNLLDNMDGLSGGVAAICLILLGISTQLVGQQFFMSSISFALAGCIVGFLRFNISPSSIFMGDAGSLFIGYAVSALTIQATFYQSGTLSGTPWAVVMPFVILAVPIFDTLSVILIRVRNGKPIYVGDKNHFSHRLVALGMSHRRAVFFIHLITLCEGSAALILAIIPTSFGAYVVLTQTIIFVIIISMLENIHNRFNNNTH